MTARRPTLDHKPPSRTAEKKRQAELDNGYSIKSEGKVYSVTLGDITETHARELRENTGGGFMRLLGMLAADPDVDLIATAIWFARRVSGEDIALEDVSFTYRELLSDGFDIEQGEQKDDSPEA